MAHLETKHIFQDPISHFHDHGRKSNDRNWWKNLVIRILSHWTLGWFQPHIFFYGQAGRLFLHPARVLQTNSPFGLVGGATEKFLLVLNGTLAHAFG